MNRPRLETINRAFKRPMAAFLLPKVDEELIVVGMFDRGLFGFNEGGRPLKSGRRSPYYYNMRGSLSFDKKLDQSGQMSLDRQRKFRRALASGYADQFFKIKHPIDHVFGKAQAATAPAAVAAYESGISYLWERVDEPNKNYGNHQKIEGDYEEGDYVLMADDVTSDGLSKVQGSLVLRAIGLRPVAITLQFDREEGGVQTLEQQYGFEVNSITTLSRAVRILSENQLINQMTIDALIAYHEQLKIDGVASTFKVL